MKHFLMVAALVAVFLGVMFLVGSCSSKEEAGLKSVYDSIVSTVPHDVVAMAEEQGNELGWRVNDDELTDIQNYYYCIGFIQGYRYFFDR